MRQNTGEKDVQSSRCSLSKKEVNDVEISILNAIQHMRTPMLDTIMCVITKLGNAGMIWILLTVILLIIPKTRRTGVILMLALCVDVSDQRRLGSCIRVVEAAREGGIPVTICGSAVGNPANTLQYLQLGLRSFSVSPQNLIEVKKALMNAKIK